MHKRRKGDKSWIKKPDWMKTKAEKDKEKEAWATAEANLKLCLANLRIMKDKHEELAARLAELDHLLKK